MDTFQDQASSSSTELRNVSSDDNMDQFQPKQKLNELINVVDSLKTEASQELAGLLQEVGHVRAQLKTKESALKQMESENKNLRDQHDLVYQTLMTSHRKSCAELERAQEELRNEISALKEDNQKQNDLRAEVEDREIGKEAEISKFREAAHRSDESLKEVIKRSEGLEDDLKEASKGNEQLRNNLQRSQSKVAELSDTNASLEEMYHTTHHSLDSIKKELTALRSSAVELVQEDLAITTTRLNSLWQSASFLINKYFRSKLPQSAFTDYELWRRLRGFTGNSVPLPRTDSVPAQNMRYVVILAFLIQLIDEEIFQPNYIADERINIRRGLLIQAVQDSKKEAFYRAILLTIRAEEQARILQGHVTSVVTSFMSFIQGTIEQDKIDSLHADVKTFVSTACEVWQRIQRLQERFEPNLEYIQDKGFDWQAISLQGEKLPNGEEATKPSTDKVTLVIFPRIYIAKDAEPRPVTSGVVLMEFQTVAAAQELRNEGPPSPKFGRDRQSWTGVNGGKRQFRLSNEVDGFLDAGTVKGYQD